MAEDSDDTFERPHIVDETGFAFIGARAGDPEPVEPEDPPTDTEVIERILDEALEQFGSDSAFGTPDRQALAADFFDFSYLDDATEVERYWLNPPYAYASILYDEDSRTNFYHVTEPALDETERYIKQDLTPIIKEKLANADLGTGVWTAFDDSVIDAVAEYDTVLSATTLHKLAYTLTRDFRGYGRIEPLLRDRAIEDISGDGADVPVFVYHDRYRDLPTNIVLDDAEMNGTVRRLAQRAGEPISFAEPIVSATLPDNHRVQLTLGSDIGPRGSNFTIRLFKAVPLTPIDLIRRNTYSAAEIAFLWLCVEHRRSVLFVGPTASGKTTSMNAVTLFIEPYTKVVTIERTRELTIPHDNWIAGVTRQGEGRTTATSEVTMNDLLKAALHQRPEYLLVGEIRTDPEVLRTFLQSIFTGHPGSTTFHAHDVPEAINRFRSEPFNLSSEMIATIDLVVVQRQVNVGDRRERRAVRIAELRQDWGDDLQVADVFKYHPENDEHRSMLYSDVLDEIRSENGWTVAELEAELDRRERFLNHLVETDVSDGRDIWAAIFAYRRDPDRVLDEVTDGTFDPTSIKINYYD